MLKDASEVHKAEGKWVKFHCKRAVLNYVHQNLEVDVLARPKKQDVRPSQPCRRLNVKLHRRTYCARVALEAATCEMS